MTRWLWIQLVQFQALWLICVMGQNDLILLALLMIGVHFMFSPAVKQDMRVLPLALIGISIDATLALSGVFAFGAFPFWLGLLWAGFSLSLGHSLVWLKKIPTVLLIPMAAVMGPASYLAGWKLDAVELPFGVSTSMLLLALIWACLLPLLLKLDTRLRSV
ncbi:MAG: DUF2878 domain-containing protein [Gammaproteobacteria bacterium]|nr:DUF2878 domain-containing protein [Gammaproteobacteria bacterium]